MKMQTLRKTLIAAAATVAAATFAPMAYAVPVAPNFIINPVPASGAPIVPLGQSNFEASAMTVSSSELLHSDFMNNTHSAQGAAAVQGFKLGNNPLTLLDTGLGNYYKLYVTFELKDKLATGSFNGANSTYDLTQLDIKFWADPDKLTVITPAGSGVTVGDNPLTVPVEASYTSGTETMVTGSMADDILLAVGSLKEGKAGLNAAGGGLGAFLNATLSFAVCSGSGTAKQGATTISTGLAADCDTAAGLAFFAEPQPFYDVAFSALNNAGPTAFVHEDGTVAITTASGDIVFANSVPEPGSLALFGLGLMGLMGLSRRKA
jgi:hypothetical protein